MEHLWELVKLWRRMHTGLGKTRDDATVSAMLTYSQTGARDTPSRVHRVLGIERVVAIQSHRWTSGTFV